MTSFRATQRRHSPWLGAQCLFLPQPAQFHSTKRPKKRLHKCIVVKLSGRVSIKCGTSHHFDIFSHDKQQPLCIFQSCHKSVTNMTKAAGNCGEVRFFRNAPLTAEGAASEPRGTKRVVAGQSTGNRPRNANHERMGREVTAPDATHTNINPHKNMWE